MALEIIYLFHFKPKFGRDLRGSIFSLGSGKKDTLNQLEVGGEILSPRNLPVNKTCSFLSSLQQKIEKSKREIN